MHLPIEDVRAILHRILELGDTVESIEIVGDEPLSHPAILEILDMCRRLIKKPLAIHSNGIPAGDISLCRQLADLQVEVLLDCNTLDPRISVTLQGRDITERTLMAIDNLGLAGARITLMSELTEGINEGVARDVLELMRRHNHILRARIQVKIDHRNSSAQCGYLPVDESVRIVCRSCEGLKPEDFVPESSAHPLCYLVCWMRKTDTVLEPGLRFKTGEEAPGILGTSKEGPIRCLSIHSPMGAGNFDCSRAMRCPEMLALKTGRLMPACLYEIRQNGKGGRNE